MEGSTPVRSLTNARLLDFSAEPNLRVSGVIPLIVSSYDLYYKLQQGSGSDSDTQEILAKFDQSNQVQQLIASGDYHRTQASVAQSPGGNLYGVLPTGSKDGNGLERDVLAWFILQPTLTSSPSLTANIVAQNYVVPPNGYSMSYPAFAVNKAGVGVIGATITNPDPNVAGGFPSASFIRFSGFPRGNITVTGQGATSDDGFTGCRGPGPGEIGRWGDYGAATVDAASGFYYVANEYIPDPKRFPRGFATNWGTFITRVH
jgi:hypothetical protein